MTYSMIEELIEQATLDEASRLGIIRSHIYGYTYCGSSRFEVVDHEAEVVANVISQLAMIDFIPTIRLLEMICDDYRKAVPQIRNRSGRLWTPNTIASLVRPIYSGQQFDDFGILRRVTNYPQIVSPDFYYRAARRLKKIGMA